MIRGLFARLTADPKRGQPLFDAAVGEARRPHWYVEGAVPDTVEGRFAMVATVLALILVRLESSGPQGDSASIALTERFIEAMDAEVRQMGVGEPGLGKQVRSLVGALANRVGHWRSVVGSEDEWAPAVLRSLYRGQQPGESALAHSESALRDLWRRIDRSDLVVEGRIA